MDAPTPLALDAVAAGATVRQPIEGDSLRSQSPSARGLAYVSVPLLLMRLKPRQGLLSI